jgi:hypothetical protein
VQKPIESTGDRGGKAQNGALDLLERVTLNTALDKIKQAIEGVAAADAADPSLDLTHVKVLLALAGKSEAAPF